VTVTEIHAQVLPRQRIADGHRLSTTILSFLHLYCSLVIKTSHFPVDRGAASISMAICQYIVAFE
jgi:hypothetical protein